MVGKGERRYQRMLTVIMCLISLVMVIPLVLLVMASITSNNEIVMHGYSFWPKEFSLDAYKYIWNEKAQIFHAYGVTVLVTVIGTALGTMLTLLYGYVLAQPKFPGKSFLAFYLFFTMLFNGGLVPTYIMYTRYLHLKNSIAALIIPGLLMNAFNVILARTFIQSKVPVALKEAAEIDVEEFLPEYTDLNEDNIDEILKKEVGKVFVRVLEDAGVYKCTPEGREAFGRFIKTL